MGVGRWEAGAFNSTIQFLPTAPAEGLKVEAMNERLKPFTRLLWLGLQAWNFETNSGLDSKLESLKGLLWSGLKPGGCRG